MKPAPQLRLRVDFNDLCSVGAGKIRLLEAIGRTGSLSQAAREIGMSYRRAWLLVDSMNAGFDTPVISATVGGSGGGGASLTAFGRELIGAYRGLEARLSALAAQHLGGIAARARNRRGGSGGRGAGAIAPRRSISKPLKRAT
jgi:molybdate transport system regulatory protein